MVNIRYLCGFTGSAGIMVLTRSGAEFFTDGRYTQQARTEVAGVEKIVSKGDPFLQALDALKRGKTKSLGLDFAHLPVATFKQIEQQLGNRVKFKDGSGMIEGLRAIKDPDEISEIRSAVNLGAALFPTALKHIRPSVRESQIAAEIEHEARRLGAEGMSFDTIVAGGARSALPHGRATNQRLPKRGFVVLDFGVILTGYCSDMTRTVHIGKVDAGGRRMYDAVLLAQQAAIKKVGPGVAVSAVDGAARSVLDRAGVGQYFTHSTGHGVGLEIHEAPRIASGQNQKLQPGMVVTVEPGIYVPGVGGVRIEDMVLVTDRGREILTPTTKKLITI